jgi:diguanylate cyclase (GGDEF)-like protein
VIGRCEHQMEPAGPSAPQHAWRTTLIVGLLLIAAQAMAPIGWRPRLYEILAAAAPIGILVAMRVHRPVHRLPWFLLAGGSAGWVVGDVLFNSLDEVFPSIADAVYLAAYPAVLIGAMLVVRERLPGRDLPGLVDAAAVTVAASIPAWMFVMSPMMSDGSTSLAARLVALAYPLADLFVIAVLVRLLVTPGRRTPTQALLLSGLFVNLVADTIYAVPSVSASYSAASPLEQLYLLGYLFTLVASLHPSMGEGTGAPLLDRSLPAVRWRIAMLALAGISAPALLAVQAIRGAYHHIPLLLIGWCVLLALVILRVAGLVRSLSSLAGLDTLTGLPNRMYLIDRLDKLLQRRRGDTDDIALLYVDLDRFKVVNDTVGHAGGDILLVEVSQRLRDTVRPGDLVSRLGGDEFVVLCEDIHDEATARVIADRLVAAVALPIWIHGAPYFVSASVGISRVMPEVTEPDMLLRHADAAMYQAKEAGKSRSQVFDPMAKAPDRPTEHFERDLRTALARDELSLHYQPIVDLGTGAIRAVEAFLRWPQEDHVRMAASIVPIANDSGLIVPVGRWVVRAACQQLRAWRDAGLDDAVQVVVNVSHRELLDPDFLRHLARCLDDATLAPSSVVLEVDEEEMADIATLAFDALRGARDLGTDLCIDRFGTGRRSLLNIGRLPITGIKLHRPFADGVGVGRHDIVLGTVADLAANLGLEATVSGVETHEQRHLLERLGFPRAQGVLWSPALSGDAIVDTPVWSWRPTAAEQRN